MKKISKNEQLFDAVADGNIEKAKELLKAGAKATTLYAKSWYYGKYGYANKSILEIFLREAHSEEIMLNMVTLLLENGANPKHGDSLKLACRHGHLEIAELLIDKGVDINHKNASGMTALMFACLNGHLENNNLEIVKFLKEKGANLDTQDEWGRTALICACYYGHLEIVKLLKNAGADINSQDEDGMTALGLAKKLNYKEIIKFLEKNK